MKKLSLVIIAVVATFVLTATCPQHSGPLHIINGPMYVFGPDTIGVYATIDIVIMGDGFTAESYEEGSTHSFDMWVERTKQAILGMDPYSNFPCAFSFWQVDIVSDEDNADHYRDGQPDLCRDTALNSAFGRPDHDPPYPDRFIWTPTPERIFDAAGYSNVAWDIAIVLVNSDSTGGSAVLDYGLIMASIAPGFEATITHELGHYIGSLWYEGGLADEYPCDCCGQCGPGVVDADTYPSGDPEPTEPNVTKETSLASIKWKQYFTVTSVSELEASSDPSDEVFVFEGGRNYRFGIWRPQLECHMNDMWIHPEFCVVCNAALTQVLDKQCKLIQGQDVFGPIATSAKIPFNRKMAFKLPGCFDCEYRVEIDGNVPEDTRMVIIDSSGGVVAKLGKDAAGTFTGGFTSQGGEEHLLEIEPRQAGIDEVTIDARVWIDGREIALQ